MVDCPSARPRPSRRSPLPFALLAIAAIAATGSAARAQPLPPGGPEPESPAPPTVNQPMTVISDIQEANSITGVVTARGNVQIDYPARQLQATSAQAQYFSNERRLVLQGDVMVLQQGSSLRAETVTYLVDEGRAIAVPAEGRQVESVYLVPDTAQPVVPVGVGRDLAPFDPKPAFKTPESDPASGSFPELAPGF